MTEPVRSVDQTAISVSIGRTLLDQIDVRAAALGLNRSQYFAQLARADLAKRGELTLREVPVNLPSSSVPSKDTTYKLRRILRRKGTKPGGAAPPGSQL